ncbi:MAG: DUF5996 family protein [Rhizomicrobium sp.]|jgi:hypothetical protein
MSEDWPDLPLAAWKDTRDTLHLWTQIVGKTRLALTPWLNHAWHVTLDVSARGLATPLFHAGGQGIEIEFDFVVHRLNFRSTNGETRWMPLEPMTVADFYDMFLQHIDALGIDAKIDGAPNELEEAIAFADDTKHAAYDAAFARRFWRILVSSHDVFTYFRSAYLGKVSPVHFFWGSFDLAVTRFSGRRAPPHPGGIPHLPDAVVREAYSHEVSSAGFWPGGGVIDYPAFYSYAYPAPDGFAKGRVSPADAFFSAELGEFILPYDAVRTAGDPEACLLEFLESTYSTAADCGQWNRDGLECGFGELGKPRMVG